ncbi:hypothetical protein AB0F33_35570, partial [Streptomyces parvus]
ERAGTHRFRILKYRPAQRTRGSEPDPPRSALPQGRSVRLYTTDPPRSALPQGRSVRLYTTSTLVRVILPRGRGTRPVA